MTEILIIVFCLVMNAILSCIEMAFVTVSKPHLKKMAQQNSTAALRVLSLKKNPERVLSVLQIGITLVGAVSAAVSGAGAEDYLTPRFMEWFAIDQSLADSLAIAVIVLPLTYFSVVIGELVPKSVALRFPLKFALLGGYVLILLDRLFSPFVFFLEISTKFFTKIIMIAFSSEKIFDSSREIDIDNLTEPHKQYIFNLIDVDKRTVKDVMVPWEDVITVDVTSHHHDILDKIRESRHTRFPVLQDNEVIGILHTKEFVSETEISKLDWTKLIRDAIILTPKEPILTTLRRLQTSRKHIAVIKTGDRPIGVVTLEDIFEEVVGEIYDEDDDPRTLLSLNSKVRTMPLDKKRNS